MRCLPLTLMLLVGILLGLFLACGDNADPRTVDYTIAVIPRATDDAWWTLVATGVRQAERDLGNVRVIWQGPAHANDADSQVTLLQTFLAQGLDGICLAPVDHALLVQTVTEIRAQGLPVVVFDSGVDTEDITSFIATDNYKGGYLAGEKLTALLAGKGAVVLLRFRNESAPSLQREQGFLDAIGKYPDMKVISSDQHAGDDSDQALDQARKVVAKWGDRMNGIFTPNVVTTAVMMLALREKDLYKKIAHVGFDSSQELVQSLEAKEIQALVVQDPIRMGYLTVASMVAVLQGRPVEKRIDTGTQIVTHEDLVKPEVRILVGLPVQ